MILSSSVNRVALLVAVLLAAGIAWIAIKDREPLLIVLGLGLLLVGPFIRRTDAQADEASAVRCLFGADRVRRWPLRRRPPPPALAQPTSIPGMSPQVQALLLGGNKIGAIKRYREEYGSGLKDAKDAVDEFERRLVLPH